MTVEQLIDRLLEFDPSLPVRMVDDRTGRTDLDSVSVRHANLPAHEQFVELTTARIAREPR